MYEKIRDFLFSKRERKVFTTMRVRVDVVRRLNSLRQPTDTNMSDILERILDEYEAQRK